MRLKSGCGPRGFLSAIVAVVVMVVVAVMVVAVMVVVVMVVVVDATSLKTA